RAPVPGDGSPPPETTAAIKTISEKLQTLTLDIGAVRNSVDSFSGKLDVRIKSSEALQNIWRRLYTTEYSADQLDKLVKETGQVIEIYNWLRPHCAQSNAPVTQISNHLQSVVAGLDT